MRFSPIRSGNITTTSASFFEVVPNLLRAGGQFSWFNGLAGTNPHFHDVYCQLAEMQLLDMGLSTRFLPLPIRSDAPGLWKGVKRRYWNLDVYNLPIVRFSHELEEEEQELHDREQ